MVVAGVHAGFPALAGIERSVDVLNEARVGWIAAAFAFSVLSLGCYVAVFRYVVGGVEGRIGWSASYQTAMAGQAASTLVTAAGAGGIALQLWVLGRAGLSRSAATARVVAFLAFHYVIYLAALIVFGAGLWLGVLPGEAPVVLTLVPALGAGAVVMIVVFVARRPGRFESRVGALSDQSNRRGRLARRLRRAPALLADGLRYAAELLRPPSRGVVIVAFALGYWTANVAILAACFAAFGEPAALPGLVQAFFVGMTVNLLPLLPGGVGSVEAGMIGALLAFGEPGAEVVVSVLAYRLIGFWLPTLPEAVAYLQLRRTVARWGAGEHAPVGASTP